MEENPKEKWFQEEAVEVFRRSVFSELYGLHLFTEKPLVGRDYHLFQHDEKGDAVWLLQRDPRQREYEILAVEEPRKLSPGQPVLPRVCKFWDDTVYISSTQLAVINVSVKDIEEKVIKDGQAFAQIINRAFVDVLMASVDSKVSALGKRLDDILAEVGDGLSREGFNADRFLFPHSFLHRFLQQDIILPDNEIQNRHYVGKTKTGLYAFWSGELSEDTALIFDSTAGLVITQDPHFDLAPTSFAGSIGVGGVVNLNPIVSNTRSVIALEGVGQVIELALPQTSSASAAPQSELAPIGEIRSALEGLPFLKATKTHLRADFEDVARTYQHEAYKACVVMCGAVMEGLLLGNLERAKNIKLLWDAGRLTGFTTYNDVRNSLRQASLEDLINHTRKSNCVDGFTDEIAKMVQRCRNSIHPGRVLRGDEVFDAFDKKVADLALTFLNVLCSRIAKS